MRTYFYPGPKRLAAAAKLAGFSDTVLKTVVAVGGHESSGDAWIIGSVNPDGTRDYGTWQINDGAHRVKHPDWFHATGPQWANHVDNAKMAFAVYTEAGNSFRPWVSYNTGRYKGVRNSATGQTWLDWATTGIAQMNAALKAGTKLEVIASVYLEEK